MYILKVQGEQLLIYSLCPALGSSHCEPASGSKVLVSRKDTSHRLPYLVFFQRGWRIGCKPATGVLAICRTLYGRILKDITHRSEEYRKTPCT